ncbi:MAG: hypothetical protein VKP62_06405 [Candidatus Sericytochromatia bacterium]|nr:hypothetical protein [Candidatus Sericytochromatia bacterium]
MTAPNLASPTTITGKVATVSLTTTSATSVLSNAASSNKCLRVVSLIVSNVDGTNAADITINYYSAAALGGTATEIASTVSVPADASLVVIDRSTALYLEEDRSLGATAGSSSDLKVVCVYEEIS